MKPLVLFEVAVCLLSLLATPTIAGYGSPRLPVVKSQIRKNKLSVRDLNDQQWSQDALHDLNTTQWTKREAVDLHALERRGYKIDTVQMGRKGLPNAHGYGPGVTSRVGRRYPVHIILCFQDRAAETLRPSVYEAVRRWHDALGCDSGVGFVFWDEEPYCQGVPDDAVWIRNVGRGAPGAILGTQSHTLPLYVDLPDLSHRPFRGWDPANGATHELGHTLGLAHEHQRPDGWSYITYNCQNIYGFRRVYAELTAPGHTYELPDVDPARRRPLTIQDICSIQEVSTMAPFHSWWTGASFVPFTRIRAGSGWANGLGYTAIVTPYGAFDHYSVMMYTGGMLDTPHGKIMTWIDGSTIAPSTGYPSPGDVAAVISMYPRIPLED